MFVRSVRIAPSDVGSDGRIKLRSLLDYFQDTAGLAVEGVEGTATELLQKGYAWVVMKYEIDFHAPLPKLDQSIDIHTFHDPFHGYNTLRVFRVYSGERLIVSAKTSWLLVDVKSGRPVKPLAHIPGIDGGDSGEIEPQFREIPEAEGAVHSSEISVKYHDTDSNGHVNHAVYFEWVYELGIREDMTRELLRIAGEFRSGAKRGEAVVIEYSIEGDMELCRILRAGVKKPCANFSVEWKRGE